MAEPAGRQSVTVAANLQVKDLQLQDGNRLLDIDENNGKFEQLHLHGAHLHAAATVLPCLHKPNEVKIDMAVNTRYDPNTTSRQQSSIRTRIAWVRSTTLANKQTFPNNSVNHHNQQSKNKNNTELHTCHTV
eukprot:5145560-Amphidinium_carterae.2